MKAIKYNEEKTLRWLSVKVRKVYKALSEQNVFVDNGAKSATFIKSEKLQNKEDNSMLKKKYKLF